MNVPMNSRLDTLASTIESAFAGKLTRVPALAGEISFEVAASELVSVCQQLRDEPQFKFEQLIDVVGVDYLHFGRAEWATEESTARGFSRGVNAAAPVVPPERRFAVLYHLLSITHNIRVRLRAYCSPGEPPLIDSVCGVWAAANWPEREVFDLFGVLFRGHPDLRRILTDYGFIGHPFRKDFPLIGNVEVRYDPEQGRVIYQPVTIEPRTLVPRVIRDDNRYDPALTAADGNPVRRNG
jgi:NADH-quinone oxidoreductase subunit C